VNTNEYISSGIVESYVLGLASPEEVKEFETMCQQYPEVLAARNDFEIALEKQLLEDAVAPVLGVKEKVMNAIRQESFNQPKIITMEQTTNRSSGFLRFAAAAAVILFLAAGYFAYTFYSDNKKLKTSNTDLQAKVEVKDSILNKMSEETEMMKNPNVAVVNMTGTTKAPHSSTNIYWDSTSSNVYLVVKNMPKLPSDKQYQLWALIDGKPKDLGLFDVQGDGRLILKMNNTQKADAFAITIENRGNTGGPTLDQLQTMGKTSL
jgi:anti-sigma-K factor RskA